MHCPRFNRLSKNRFKLLIFSDFLLKKQILAFLCSSMVIKSVSGLICSIMLLSGLSAMAQKTDTVKRDSIKTDTTLLNKLRIEPGKNALPVRVRQIQITPITIPVTLPDYQFSYWHKWTVFNVNFNPGLPKTGLVVGQVIWP
jgi:hypothetical protein